MPSHPPSSPRRAPGGQPGNSNAYKHGFYTSRFSSTELRSLDRKIPKGLTEEITMLRLLIRRHVDFTRQELTFDEYNNAMRIICLACLTLNRLLRSQIILGDTRYDEYVSLIDEALDRVRQDWQLDLPPEQRSPDGQPSPLAIPQT